MNIPDEFVVDQSDLNPLKQHRCELPGCGIVFDRPSYQSATNFKKRKTCIREHAVELARRLRVANEPVKQCAGCKEDMPVGDMKLTQYRRRDFCSEHCRNVSRSEKSSENQTGVPKSNYNARPGRAKKKTRAEENAAVGLSIFGDPFPETVWRPESWGGPIPKTEAHVREERRMTVEIPFPRQPADDQLEEAA